MSLPNTYYHAEGAAFAEQLGQRAAANAFAQASGATPTSLPAQARVVVVGGGYAGLNTALSLAERGVETVLLEQQQIGFGASGRNGGFVFAGYSLGEAALLKRLGAPLAKAWYQRTVQAVNLIRQRIARYAIDCDAVDAGVLWANVFDDPRVLETRRTLLREHFDADWQPVSRSELRAMIASDRYSGALFERNALHVNPLKMARGLAAAASEQGVLVRESVEVQSVSPLPASASSRWRVKTAMGEIDCEHVVLCGGGYLAGALARDQPKLARARLPIATYVMATEPLGERLQTALRTQAAVYDTRFAFDYYRASVDSRIVWGGRIHINDAAPDKVARLLRRDLLRVFPQLADVRIDYAWSGLMSYARHEMPQVGAQAPGLWHAQAFGGHGLAPTCVAGSALAAAIAENDQSLQQLAQFGLSRTYGGLGLAAAQCKYWWLQWRDQIAA